MMKVSYKDIKEGMWIKVCGEMIHVIEVYPEGDYWYGYVGIYDEDCCFDYVHIGSTEVELVK